MGCLSHRKKQTEDIADQKWDYINLRDFKAKGCGTYFAYGYLWFSLLISLAVYSVDSFTAVNLLVFNQWSSQIEPAIPFDISKWIFSVCIILSFVNLVYEGIRAIRVMRHENIAECYMDNLAVRWESMRLGSGQGYRRFLVFAELTKGKKGAEYIALFTYFNFQSWIRVIICSGPRQVVNAFTLKSVYEAKLSTHANSVEGSIAAFFGKIRTLALEDYQQALILSGMCFTAVVWIFSFLLLFAAVLFYVFFLWHWLPRADGGLSGYCERKITKALMKVVTQKVNKALAQQEADRFKLEAKSAKKKGETFVPDRKATLPTLPNVGPISDDKLPEMPMLGRSETMTTLPPYMSRPGTPGSGLEMGAMDQKRPIPSRTGTMTSMTSYSSRAPLTRAAADMGYGRSASPAPSLPDFDPNSFPPQRPPTSNSMRSHPPRLPLAHIVSNPSLRGPMTESPVSMAPDATSAYPAPRSYDAFSQDGRASPAPSMMSRTGTGPTYPRQPYRSATGPVPPRGPQYAPYRNNTAPAPLRGPRSDYAESSYGYDVESQPDHRYQY